MPCSRWDQFELWRCPTVMTGGKGLMWLIDWSSFKWHSPDVQQVLKMFKELFQHDQSPELSQNLKFTTDSDSFTCGQRCLVGCHGNRPKESGRKQKQTATEPQVPRFFLLFIVLYVLWNQNIVFPFPCDVDVFLFFFLLIYFPLPHTSPSCRRT